MGSTGSSCTNACLKNTTDEVEFKRASTITRIENINENIVNVKSSNLPKEQNRKIINFVDKQKHNDVFGEEDELESNRSHSFKNPIQQIKNDISYEEKPSKKSSIEISKSNFNSKTSVPQIGKKTPIEIINENFRESKESFFDQENEENFERGKQKSRSQILHSDNLGFNKKYLNLGFKSTSHPFGSSSHERNNSKSNSDKIIYCLSEQGDPNLKSKIFQKKNEGEIKSDHETKVNNRNDLVVSSPPDFYDVKIPLFLESDLLKFSSNPPFHHTYSIKYCVVNDNEFKFFNSKQACISKHKPSLTIQLTDIIRCDFIKSEKMKVKTKKNQSRLYHFYIKFYPKRDEMRVSITNDFNIEDILNHYFQKTVEIKNTKNEPKAMKVIEVGKNVYFNRNKIIQNFEIDNFLIFASEDRNLIEKWINAFNSKIY